MPETNICLGYYVSMTSQNKRQDRQLMSQPLIMASYQYLDMTYITLALIILRHIIRQFQLQ